MNATLLLLCSFLPADADPRDLDDALDVAEPADDDVPDTEDEVVRTCYMVHVSECDGVLFRDDAAADMRDEADAKAASIAQALSLSEDYTTAEWVAERRWARAYWLWRRAVAESMLEARGEEVVKGGVRDHWTRRRTALRRLRELVGRERYRAGLAAMPCP